jgi:hypothetical protein
VTGPIELDEGRRRRLTIIVSIAIVLALAGLITYVLGSRAANEEVSRVRTAAETAVVSGADIAASAYGSTEIDPVAKALGVDDGQVSAVSASGAE